MWNRSDMTGGVRLVASLLVALASVSAAGAQRRGDAGGDALVVPNGTAFLLGQVVDAISARPVANAVVALAGGGGTATQRVVADHEGRFLFRDLRRGSYTLSASAADYLDGGYGQRQPGGNVQPIVVGEADHLGNIVVRLWEEATLSGRIADELNEPISGLTVSVFRTQPSGQAGSLTVSGTTTTDDQGAYFVGGLQPGDYILGVVARIAQLPTSLAGSGADVGQAFRSSGSSALEALATGAREGVAAHIEQFIVSSTLPTQRNEGGKLLTYATTFHPATHDPATAETVALRSGEHRANVDVQLQPTASTRLSGTLTGVDPVPANLAVHLIPAFAAKWGLESALETAVTSTGGNGSFHFVAVPPGEYVIRAWTVARARNSSNESLLEGMESALWSELPLIVGDTEMRGVNVPVQAGVTLKGHLSFEGIASPPNAQQMQLYLSMCFGSAWPPGALSSMLATRVTADGDFTTQALPPRPYALNCLDPNILKGWHLLDVTQGGSDLGVTALALDTRPAPVTFKFTDKTTEVSGMVLNSDGKPDTVGTVVILPANYKAWLDAGGPVIAARAVPVSQQGTYSISDLKPGAYLIVATPGDIAVRWQERSSVEKLVIDAVRITLTAGAPSQQNLKGSR